MKRKLELTSIGDLEKQSAIIEIQDGNHGEKHPKATDYVDDGVPFIMANNVIGNTVDIENAAKLPPSLADSLRIGFARTGDVLLTHKGTIGNTAIVNTDLPYIMLTPQVTYYRTNPNKLLNRYLMYAFQEPLFQKTMKSLAQQGTRPYIGITAQRRLKVRWLPIQEQHRIAPVLSAYDDLIENNRRRIQLLEQAARLLYKEWFVYLRFPGHEHVKIINGVPEGWERVPTPEAIEVNPSTRLSDEPEHWTVEMADLPIDSMVIQQAVKREGRSGSKFCNGDTLFARITPCLENGKTAFVDFMEEDEVGRGSTEFIVLRSERVTPEYVYCLARTYDFRENAIKSMVGSSGRQRVQDSCFEKFLVLVPPSTLLALFADFVRPQFRQIKTLHAQNQRLRAARDLLLPRLMNGEVVV